MVIEKMGLSIAPTVMNVGRLTGAVGAFLAVNPDVTRAAAGALGLFGMCGELAAQGARGPGSFEIALRDFLWSVEEEQVRAGVKVRRP